MAFDFTDAGPRGLEGTALLRRADDELPLEDVTSEDAVSPDDDDGGAPLDPDAALTTNGARRIYVALCVMAQVDGPPSPSQRRELAAYRGYLGLGPREVAFLEGRARRCPYLRVGRRAEELDLLLGALVDMAAADGRVSPDEERLLQRVSGRAGWSRTRLRAAVARAEEGSRHVTPVRVAVRTRATRSG